MADLKPLGSEKLNGDDKLKRILELTYFNNNNKKTTTTSNAELVSESKTGGIYGIVKEKDAYYVKRGLNESSLDYIGGMFMKNKNRFSSYGEALKRLDLLKGQEELQEATKYVLKPSKPKEEAPMAEPTMDAPVAAPTDELPAIEDLPSDDMSTDELPSDDMSTDGEEAPSKRSDYMAEVQKYSGKLGQELRDLHDRMESDDIKYVLNMIISAVDLDKLDLDDIEEIAKKFEREEEEPSEEPTSGEEEVPSDEPTSGEDEDLGEDAMSALDEFINTPIQSDEIDMSNYDLGQEVSEEDDSKDSYEIDIDEIKNDINNSISSTLSKYFK